MEILSWILDALNFLNIPTYWKAIIVASLTTIGLSLATYRILSLIKFLKLENLQIKQQIFFALMIFLTSFFAINSYIAGSTKGIITGIPARAENSKPNSDQPYPTPAKCGEWDLCTDFKDDQSVDNTYYTHSKDDPQVLTLADGPFASPPLFFSADISPFYNFQLDAQPKQDKAANIIIVAKEMFELFVGDNDYRSFAFLYWDPTRETWTREKDSKIYLSSLGKPDIAPETQFTVKISTRQYENTKATVNVSLVYQSKEGNSATATFTKTVDIPSGDASNFLTRIGPSLYRTRDNIPQAKFTLMGLDKQ